MDDYGISWFTAFWLAVVLIVGLSLIIAALLRRDRSFGNFSRIVGDTHEDNKLVQQKNALIQEDNIRLFDQLEECQKRLPPPSTEKSA